jgi:hypothetical protein
MISMSFCLSIVVISPTGIDVLEVSTALAINTFGALQSWSGVVGFLLSIV